MGEQYVGKPLPVVNVEVAYGKGGGAWDHRTQRYLPGPGRPKGSRRVDLSGQTFRHLTVIERVEDARGSKARYRCRCDCGQESVVRGDHLISGQTVSCGHVGFGKPYAVVGPLASPPPVPKDWRKRAANAQVAFIERERRRNGA